MIICSKDIQKKIKNQIYLNKKTFVEIKNSKKLNTIQSDLPTKIN